MAALSAYSRRGLGSYKFWDESTKIVWPDVDSPPVPSPQVVAPVKQETWVNVPWKVLQARADEKVKRVAEAAREHLFGGDYQHLPHVEVDWSIEETLKESYFCRVVGLSCWGASFDKMKDLKRHLGNKTHLEYEAQLAAAWVELPSSSQPSPSLQPPTPVAPAAEIEHVEVMEVEELEAERAIDTSHSAVAAGSGSSKRRSAPDAEIPDLEEREARPPPHLRRSRRLRRN